MKRVIVGEERRALEEALEGLLTATEENAAAAAEHLSRLSWRYSPNRVDYLEVCDNLYDGIHITDGQGRILFINQAYTRTTGIRLEDVYGKKVSEIEGRLYRGSVTQKVLEKRKRVNSVATILEMDKEVLVTGTPVFDSEGNIRMVVTNTRDFPELKQLEQQLLTLTEEQKKANEELAYLRNQQAGDKLLFYHSDAMRATMELVQTIAPTDVTVLITGESGTGKELVANEIYQASGRRGRPFIKVNCAAIPADLLESELFGYEEGAFTGARRTGKSGMFELANTGVLLLDEIGDMSLPLQTKLLRALQQREIMRIGGSKTIQVDIRVIASTNKDLIEEVRLGHFREDLYYRLNVVPVEIKPLRERREDISYLAAHFCRIFAKKYAKELHISDQALEALTEYPWPGNIRELENLIERLVVTNGTGAINHTQVSAALGQPGHPFRPAVEVAPTLKAQVAALEREIIAATLKKEGSFRKAAQVLGVDHSTLVKKSKQHQIGPTNR